jgi:hypothetical protein
MNISNVFRMAKSNPFQDEPFGVHWDNNGLFHDGYCVGRVVNTLAGKDLCWMAEPYWQEEAHFFDTYEEARSWLVAMYKMGGADEPTTRRRVRPAAK